MVTTNQKSLIPQDDLEKGRRMYLLAQYLMIFIRMASYSSNIYFLSTINSFFDQYIPTPFLRNFFYFLYGLLVFEAIGKLVDRYYKPKFISSSKIQSKHEESSHVLVLSNADYSYRVMFEKLIYVLVIYYLFNLIFSIALYIHGNLDSKILANIIRGAGGSLASIFGFFGIVTLSVLSQIKSRYAQVLLFIVGIGFQLLPMIYIIYALFFAR